MLLTQEPTFVMVVTQEPTKNINIYKGKKNQLLLMHFTSWNDLLLQTSSYVQLHEDVQHIHLEGMLSRKNTTFYSSFIYHLSPYSYFILP